MSTLRVDTITDEAGTGPVEFTNGINVSGGTVTGIQPSGSQTFTASGSITAGDVVGLNTSGDVSSTAAGLIAESAFFVDTSPVTSCYDEGTNKHVVLYRDWTDSGKYKTVVATVSGSTVSLGTPSNMDFFDVYLDTDQNLVAGPSGKVVLFGRYNSTYGAGAYTVGTISGTSLSWGSRVNFSSAGSIDQVNGVKATYDKSQDRFLIFYMHNDASENYATVVQAASLSGTSLSFGARVQVYNNFGYYLQMVHCSNLNKTACFFTNPSDGKTYGFLASISGTTVSVTTPTAMDMFSAGSGLDFYMTSIAYNPLTSRVALVGYDGGGYTQNAGILYSIAATSTTLTSVGQVVLPDPISGSSMAFNEDTGYILLTVSSGLGVNMGVHTYSVYVQEDSVSYTESCFGSTTGYYLSAPRALSYDPDAGGFFMWGISSYERGTTERIKVLDFEGPHANPIGIAEETRTNGQAVSVSVAGSIVTGLSGLSAGSPYGVNPYNGNLTINGSSTLGYALSSTSLYIK
ncbi:hypothetical protein HWB26_gp49 [Lentibacter phage vB_LenP_ICBM2]|uniref:Uncharacterized protein n=1 Tax=Lentibacter phage vB_LenP_ICBM2 TaxID=2847823 RepID=A0A3G2YRE6_9CAUD|nr:hypothetical protein HWB26_gp49 [Lentibacter phage vB_LenP_ICBM2]AYP28108.1 hypothetical protein vBLenPICBM2__49 [Lentibacter phage vB_LenP_ICBM2]